MLVQLVTVLPLCRCPGNPSKPSVPACLFGSGRSTDPLESGWQAGQRCSGVQEGSGCSQRPQPVQGFVPCQANELDHRSLGKSDLLCCFYVSSCVLFMFVAFPKEGKTLTARKNNSSKMDSMTYDRKNTATQLPENNCPKLPQ